jgi:hypothetical protein
MADARQKSGCGCCGFLLFGSLFLFLVLVGAALFSYWSCSTQLRKYASNSPVVLPSTGSNRSLYTAARRRLDQFFSSSSQQSVTLSGAELNALLTEAPELRFLQKGAVATLRENSAEINCSVPVNLPLFSSQYINYLLYLRPSLRGEDIELQVFRIDHAGRQLNAEELREFRSSVEHPANLILSGLNKVQLDRSIRDVRIENGTLVISR